MIEPKIEQDEEAREVLSEYIFAGEAERHQNDAEMGAKRMAKMQREHRETSPVLSGGDVDAAWEDSDDVGEEAVGGGNPTPDQSVVEEIGEAMGVTFQDNEPIDLVKKLDKRDQDRWELDPASAEDFK